MNTLTLKHLTTAIAALIDQRRNYEYYGPDLAQHMSLEEMRAKRTEIDEAINALKEAALALEQDAQHVPASDGAVPEPDWSKAPEWANWWAYNALYLLACFYKTKPNLHEESGCFVPTSDEQSWHKYQLPLGIDWRQTLRQRPQQPPGAGDT